MKHSKLNCFNSFHEDCSLRLVIDQFNPLKPESDQHLISSYINMAESVEKCVTLRDITLHYAFFVRQRVTAVE